MDNLLEGKERTCGCCKRQLPISEFYVTNKKRVDGYCKECRRARNSQTYRTGKRGKLKRASYLVITEVSDKAVRMELIKNALRVVRESIARKRRKLWEMDAED